MIAHICTHVCTHTPVSTDAYRTQACIHRHTRGHTNSRQIHTCPLGKTHAPLPHVPSTHQCPYPGPSAVPSTHYRGDCSSRDSRGASRGRVRRAQPFLTRAPPCPPVGAHHLALPLAAEAGRAAADVRPQDLADPADQETLPGDLPLSLQRPAGDLPADSGVSSRWEGWGVTRAWGRCPGPSGKFI